MNKVRKHHENESLLLSNNAENLHHDLASEDADPYRYVEVNLERDRLVEALSGLSSKLRTAIVLRDVYDLTYEDIAQELGISETAAKVRVHRARRQLKAILFPEPPAEDEESSAA